MSSFIKPLIPLTTREELDLQIMLDYLVDNLSRIDVIRTEQAHTLLKTFKEGIKNCKGLDISRAIRTDLPRRKDDLAKFFTLLGNRTRRDILRTIALYDWLSKIDEVLDGIRSIDSDIREKVISLIREISVQNGNTAVTDSKIQALNLRKKDDIIKSTGYTSLTSGSITNGVTTAAIPADVKLTFERDVYYQNIYTFYSEEVTKEAKITEKRYDTVQQALAAKLSVTSPQPFTLVDLGLGIPFRVLGVYSIDSANRKEDITDAVLGNNIQVNGGIAIARTDTSVSDTTGQNTYNFIIPKGATNLEIDISIESFDTYPLKLFELLNPRAETIRKFNILESMILDRRLVGEAYKSKKEELDQIVAGGYLREANNPSSIRVVELKKCNVYTAANATASKTELNYIQSDLKIRSVELYVDVYDPLQLIRYSIINAENEKQDISPVNSNPITTTKLVYETLLPKQIQLEITVPVEATYLPVVHGVAIIIGEVNL